MLPAIAHLHVEAKDLCPPRRDLGLWLCNYEFRQASTMTPEPPGDRPAHRDALCRDGGIVRIRRLDIDDGDAVLDFYSQLDPTSLYRRFMTHRLPHSDVLLRPLRSNDPRNEVLGVEVSGELIGLGIAVAATGSEAAEVAFAVLKSHQGRGIGTLLLEHLAASARDHGRTQFVANTLTSNLAMLDVFEQAGFRLTEQVDQDDVQIALTLGAEADDERDRRDLRSHAASVRRILHPKTVAVVGASRREGTIGHALFHNLVTTGFCGTLYPVNLRAPSVLGVAAYPSVEALPTVPDLVIVVVPSAAVSDVVVSCGETGVASIVLVTAGFAEATADGRAAQEELIDLAHYYGMRVVGPNCVGIVNADPDVALNATFSPAVAPFGPVGFASQSGALGIAALDWLQRFDLGISSFVSLGNKADVSGNDLLQYWAEDAHTRVIALYLESFGNPRKFARIAREVCRHTPIVAVKSGRTTSGRRAASSHTAALASSDFIAESLFSDAGIIRVNTLAQLFDVSRLLATQPIPNGNRIAIVGNSGGPGILAADACEGAGLQVPELSDETQAGLKEVLLAGAGVSNPVDVIAAATAEHYEAALKLVLQDPVVDSVLVIYTDPMVSDAQEIAEAISRAASTSSKPIAANFLAVDVGPSIEASGSEHPPIPIYDFPEPIAYALGHAARLGEWRRRPTEPSVWPPDVDLQLARQEVVAAAPTDGSEWVEPDALKSILGRWGIDLITTTTVFDAEEACRVATQIGFPVALKLVSDTISHKSDVGGVVLDLIGANEVRLAYRDMATRIGSDMQGALVQQMANEGTEVILGGLADPVFGPVVVFGAGGTAAEVWKDRAVALAPIDPARARDLIHETRIATLLAGYRGSPPADTEALADLVERLGHMMHAHPEIIELDLNPVIATPDGVQVVDSRCRLSAPVPPRPTPRRQLD